MIEKRKSQPSQVGVYQNQVRPPVQRVVPNFRMGCNMSLYEQNLKQQEMRLAQHPQRQLNRHSVDQKCKELQLQKEKELNEEFERGTDSFASFNMYSQVLPY